MRYTPTIGQRRPTKPRERWPKASWTGVNQFAAPTWEGFAVRFSHVAMIGTSVLARKYEAIIENATASARGTNTARATPVMKNDGANTETTQSMASIRGTATSRLASSTAVATGLPRPRCV